MAKRTNPNTGRRGFLKGAAAGAAALVAKAPVLEAQQANPPRGAGAPTDAALWMPITGFACNHAAEMDH